MKKTEKKENYIYICYSEGHTGGEICAGDEDNEWPSHEDEHIHMNIEEVRINKPLGTPYWESLRVGFKPKAGDRVHIVVVRYGSGSTFGHTSGHFCFVSAYKKLEDAEKEEKEISTSKERQKEWYDYFGGFEDVYVESYTID